MIELIFPKFMINTFQPHIEEPLHGIRSWYDDQPTSIRGIGNLAAMCRGLFPNMSFTLTFAPPLISSSAVINIIKRLSCPTLVRKFTTHSHLDRLVLGVWMGTLDSNILHHFQTWTGLVFGRLQPFLRFEHPSSLPNLDRRVFGASATVP